MTWADVPSGATSASRTTTVATGRGGREVEHDLGDAEDLQRRSERARSCRSGPGSRRAGGRAPGRSGAHRRPTTARLASRPSAGGGIGRRRGASGRAASTKPPDERQLAAGERSRSGCRPRDADTTWPPASDPASVAGNGSGSAYSRSNQVIAGSVVGAVRDALQPSIEEPDDLVELVEVRSRRRRRRAGRGPSCRRSSVTARRQAACIRRAASTYESIQPPTLRTAASIAS